MTSQTKNNGNGIGQIQVSSDGQYQISGDLSFHTVPSVWKASQSLFVTEKLLTIDLSGVDRSDSAGLALLVEWMRFAESKGCSIQFLNLPEQMQQIAQLCGLEEKLPA